MSSKLKDKYKNIAITMVKRPLICASIVTNSDKEYFVNIDKAIKEGADLAELRLDLFNKMNNDIASYLISNSSIPLIVTNRNKENGGMFKGDEKERLEILHTCIDNTPAYIDIELNTNEKYRTDIIKHAKLNNVGVICSYHDFNKTPSVDNIKEIYRNISKTGADLAKIVFTPKDSKDVRNILQSIYELQKEQIPFTIFGMGKEGQITRMLSLFLGSSLSYCSLNTQSENKLYQISLENTKSLIQHIERIGWDAIKQQRDTILTLSKIELNDDGSYPFASIGTMT